MDKEKEYLGRENLSDRFYIDSYAYGSAGHYVEYLLYDNDIPRGNKSPCIYVGSSRAEALALVREQLSYVEGDESWNSLR
jgi:hypothetical protein